MVVPAIDQRLSIRYFTLIRFKLQIYTNLLQLWHRSHQKVWPLQRRLANPEKNRSLPSMGKTRA